MLSTWIRPRAGRPTALWTCTLAIALALAPEAPAAATAAPLAVSQARLQKQHTQAA